MKQATTGWVKEECKEAGWTMINGPVDEKREESSGRSGHKIHR